MRGLASCGGGETTVADLPPEVSHGVPEIDVVPGEKRRTLMPLSLRSLFPGFSQARGMPSALTPRDPRGSIGLPGRPAKDHSPRTWSDERTSIPNGRRERARRADG